MDRPRLRKSIFVLAAGAAVGIGLLATGTAKGTEAQVTDPLVLELPDDEPAVRDRVNLGAVVMNIAGTILDECEHSDRPRDVSEALTYPVVVEATGSGLVELRIFAGGPLIAEVAADGNRHVTASVGGQQMTVINDSLWGHRELLTNPTGVERFVETHFSAAGFMDLLRDAQPGCFRPMVGGNLERIPEPNSGEPVGPSVSEVSRYDVTAMLLRVEDECRMSARVSGDINGAYFGDVAYFNQHALGVREGFAAGSIADPEMLEMADSFSKGLLESCEAIIRLSERNGMEIPEGCRPEAQREVADDSFANFVEEELAGDDTFGLSLIDMKAEDGTMPEGVEGLRALVGAGFTLALSGKHEGGYGTYTVKPSTLTVTAGAISGLGAITFELPGPDAATIVLRTDSVEDDEPGTFRGVLTADLETEDSYTMPGVATNRPLKIHVEAKFLARRGSLACLR